MFLLLLAITFLQLAKTTKNVKFQVLKKNRKSLKNF